VLKEITNDTAFFLYGKISVTYQGRAKSTLKRGNYAVLRKSDGSIQIHGGDLIVPRNYQGPGASLELRGKKTLVSTRKNETIRILVHDIIDFVIMDDWSTDKIKLSMTEAELVQKILDDPMKYLCTNAAHKYTELQVKYGKIDILLSDRPVECTTKNRFLVIEVKRSKVTVNNIVQLEKYMQCFPKNNTHGYIAGPCISANAAEYCIKKNIAYVAVEFS